MAFPILTIGHSTHPIEEFIELLKAHGVNALADVRTIPRSRHNPQFNKEALARSLKKEKIGYVHIPGLGGLRHAQKDSINDAWRNASFRGYADYMQTREFKGEISRLIKRAKPKKIRLVILCAEAVPWRCHRSLIGDALSARDIPVEDIFSKTNRRAHKITPWAKVEGTSVTYPADESQQELPL